MCKTIISCFRDADRSPKPALELWVSFREQINPYGQPVRALYAARSVIAAFMLNAKSPRFKGFFFALLRLCIKNSDEVCSAKVEFVPAFNTQDVHPQREGCPDTRKRFRQKDDPPPLQRDFQPLRNEGIRDLDGSPLPKSIIDTHSPIALRTSRQKHDNRSHRRRRGRNNKATLAGRQPPPTLRCRDLK